MEKLNNFTKNLKILFVEDDDLTRKQFGKILGKLFNNLEIEANGLDGFLKFQDKKLKNDTFDLIISDIDMPRMSGIEMLEKIREMDRNVPVIFITAKNSSEILLKAIDLGILNFVPKPVDVEKLIRKIQESCEKLYFQHLFTKKSNELEKYYKVIDDVAIVSRTDNQGNITYVNDNFCEATGYMKDELINQNHRILKAKEDINTSFYEMFWKKITSGETWSGTFKNVDKNGENFFRRASVVPIYDEDEKNIAEYLSISFLTTDDELQKRLLNEKLLKNIVSHKKEASDNEKIKNKYQNDIKSLRNLVVMMDNKLKKVQTESSNSNEEKLANLSDDQRIKILKQKNDEIQKMIKLQRAMKEENEKLLQEKRDLEIRVEKKDDLISSYKADIDKLKVRYRS